MTWRYHDVGHGITHCNDVVESGINTVIEKPL